MSSAASSVAVGLCAVLLAGCASTRFSASGETPGAPLCQQRGERVSALVLWGPSWRADQKDVPLREAAAQRGLEAFFDSSGCFSSVEVRRLSGGRSATLPALPERLALAAASEPKANRVLVVTVRELGPVVKLLASAALVEGGTEVVFDIDAIGAPSGASLAKFQMHWEDGGAWVIKNTSSLSQDMGAALRAALSPAAAPKPPP